MKLASPTTYLLTGVTALAAVAVAYVSQHRFGMEPCPWCVLQRLIFIVIGMLGLLGWLSRPRAVHRASGALMMLAGAAGLAAALYQHLVAAKSSSCNLTLADRIVSNTLHLDKLWPDLFEVRASCADAAVKLLGVSYDLWSAALFVALAAAAFWAWRRS